jgi:RNA polymerase sigma-70 factor, ECF subfamily
MTLVQSGGPAVKPDGASMSACILAVAATADRAAFAALFAHFAPRIKTYLLRLGAGAAQAEEVAQETMLAVWRKARLFDPTKADAATWIFTIARNQRIDALRRERRPEIAADDPAFAAESEPASDDRLVAAERARLLQDAIARLPAEQAEVVRLSFFEDRPHSEIEQVLGIPLGTVKSRLRLAVARLRNALGDQL